jgi:hypothetical protein
MVGAKQRPQKHGKSRPIGIKAVASSGTKPMDQDHLSKLFIDSKTKAK